MCTLTIVPVADRIDETLAFRVVFNRDERVDRPAGSVPSRHDPDTTSAIWPTDPVGGGTWVAVNGRGLVFALLNRTPAHSVAVPVSGLSRGVIIPQLCSSADLDEVRSRLLHATALVDRGFRLVVTDGRKILEVEGGLGSPPRTRVHRLDRAFLRTSSGLGDELVEGPRRRSFEARFAPWLESAADDIAPMIRTQDRFHRSRIPGRDEFSVYMAREDARTVSISTIEVHEHATTFHHSLTDPVPCGQLLGAPLPWVLRGTPTLEGGSTDRPPPALERLELPIVRMGADTQRWSTAR